MPYYPPGARIAGRYLVTGRPLMGGMGLVYLCHDLDDDRPVALKTFKPEYLPDRAARDRFLREGTRWVDLGAHPHVVRCYRVVRVGDGTEVYLVLELVAKEEGCADASLRSWLAPGRPLPVDQALLFALQAARGMAHAAAALPGLVHRDLKPENLLVGADRLSDDTTRRLRITDLGLATVLQASSVQTSEVSETSEVLGSLGRTQLTRGIVGTPLYMAPEQWRGEPVTAATDVYALGCILVEMLAGGRAVDGASLAALREAHCAGQVRPLPAGLPAAVCALAARCLAVEPGARYGAWAEVEAALAEAYRAVACRLAPAPEEAAALGRAERVAAGWSYREMGRSYLDLGQAETARGYFERARAAGAAEGERRLESAGLNHLGLAYADLGDARRALGYHEQALAIAREIGDRGGEGNALGNLGIAYALLGDARRAIGFYEQALTIAREIGDRRGEGNAVGNLGLAYAALGDARRAIGYYEQALAIAREIGDRGGEGNALGNLGVAYADMGDVRRAIGYHEQALAIHREIGDRRGEGADLGNLGTAYAKLGDAQRAVEYWQRATAIFDEIGDVMSAVTVGFNLAVLLAQQGHYAEALPHAQRAAQVFAQIGHAGYAQQAQALVTQLQAGQAP